MPGERAFNDTKLFEKITDNLNSTVANLPPKAPLTLIKTNGELIGELQGEIKDLKDQVEGLTLLIKHVFGNHCLINGRWHDIKKLGG